MSDLWQPVDTKYGPVEVNLSALNRIADAICLRPLKLCDCDYWPEGKSDMKNRRLSEVLDEMLTVRIPKGQCKEMLKRLGKTSRSAKFTPPEGEGPLWIVAAEILNKEIDRWEAAGILDLGDKDGVLEALHAMGKILQGGGANTDLKQALHRREKL